jgi:deoxycytidylate deaminase
MVGSTLYVTDHPCDGCFRMIVGTPIERFIGPGFAWERRH